VGGNDGISPDLLREQMHVLLDRREILPLEEAIRRLGSAEAGQIAALTFDDGYRDFVTGALPILSGLSLPATLFVPAAYIGTTNRWDAGVRAERPLLDAGELAALDRDLVEIGVHGYSHIRMVGLEPAQLDREVRQARDILSDIVGYEPMTFAYPYGMGDDFDSASEAAIAAAGYTGACSSRYGRGSTTAERFRLRRLTVSPDDSVHKFTRKLEGAYDWLGAKETLGMTLRNLGGRGR
jgi:peptidoglycan/xylan/chitin deacetylase (PgdA/CDA1 family)